MSEPKTCPECGAPLPGDAPGGLCPRCLLESATAAPSDGGSGPAIITTKARPRPGSAFGGYQIIRPLGKGGMGEVWEAEQLESGRRVALKVLGQALDSADARGRFLREGRLAASVNHPNSVYVFGTEEIDGTPVIAMELVSGGTLHDRVRERGPLPVTEAVDIILQIIAGLEAAQSIGILHRDVKPANCFMEPDGSVKVGDFGLSIATTGRAETNITVAGSILGTPAFSSPEQLRGDELTVRSDIYSVGVTLYHLLTGRTPFEADNFVKLLSRVLEEQPPSPLTHRKDLPRELARVILRCLAKQPSERFRDYAGLRDALYPFSSTAPSPATLGLRFGAGVLDMVILSMVTSATSLLLLGDVASVMNPKSFESSGFLRTMIGSFAACLLYYTLFEGLRGATPAKMLLRLRVQGADREAPGLTRALVRALIYTSVPQLAIWWQFGQMSLSPAASSEWNALIPYTYYVGLALLFGTARRRNGYASLHDRLTGTRVVTRKDYQVRPALALSQTEEPATESATKIGPYHDLGPLGATPDGQWRMGYDTRLLRKVWLRLCPPETPPVPAAQKSLNRVGRLRWLNARRPASEEQESAWDAYEGLGGKPLRELVATPQPWSAVRHWALDLAEELDASGKDGTTPATLALDHVWITDSGRAKLLDFPAPGLEPTMAKALPEPPPLPSGTGTTRFLRETLVAALSGNEEATSLPDNPQPLHARRFIEGLDDTQSPADAATALRPLIHRRTKTTRARRATIVAVCIAIPLVVLLSVQLGNRMMEKWREQEPEIMDISHLLNIRAGEQFAGRMTKQKSNEDLIGIFIAQHYSNAVSNPEVWNSALSRILITGEKRRYAEQSLDKFGNATKKEIKAAEKRLQPALRESRHNPILHSRRGSVRIAALCLAFYIGLPALITALLFRGGLLQRAAGIALVNRRGEPASRLRVFCRALITWTPALAATLLLALPESHVDELVSAGAATALAIIAVWSTALRERGIPDRLTGIWPVPR